MTHTNILNPISKIVKLKVTDKRRRLSGATSSSQRLRSHGVPGISLRVLVLLLPVLVLVQ